MKMASTTAIRRIMAPTGKTRNSTVRNTKSITNPPIKLATDPPGSEDPKSLELLTPEVASAKTCGLHAKAITNTAAVSTSMAKHRRQPKTKGLPRSQLHTCASSMSFSFDEGARKHLSYSKCYKLNQADVQPQRLNSFEPRLPAILSSENIPGKLRYMSGI